jgi:glycosyltransferase involved in cell wall biosynthesis
MRHGAAVEEHAFGPRTLLVLRCFPHITGAEALAAVATHNGLALLVAREPPGLFAERWTPERLEREHAGNAVLRDYYEDLAAVQASRGVRDVLVMGDGGYWHPSLLTRLRRQGARLAFWTGDDPEGSPVTSRPFVRHYDHAFCGGVFFDTTARIADRFREWGAPRATFIPLGGAPGKFEPPGALDEDAYFRRGRDIDVIFVGAPYAQKAWRQLRLKRHFGRRMFLGGHRWDGRGLGLRGAAIRAAATLTGVHQAPISDAALRALYRRARVGFNCHLSFGPSNLRLYELPLSGVLQVCDCPEGVAELYEPGREIVTYRSTREAIERIEYYLAHDGERIRVAAAGRRRAEREYLVEHSVARLLRHLDEGT